MPKQKNKARGAKRDKRLTRNYLTKRILIRAARAGISAAARETVAVMGYNVIARNGWIVRKYPNGRIENISRIEEENPANAKILVD